MDDSRGVETSKSLPLEEEIKLRSLLKRLFKPYCIRFNLELWNQKPLCINKVTSSNAQPSFVLKLQSPRVLHAILLLNEEFDFEEALEVHDISIIGELSVVMELGKRRLQSNKPLRLEICHTINQLRLKRLHENIV